MITKQDAMTIGMFYHARLRNADGTALRARSNGKCKTWKTRPSHFRVPIKHGLYEYGYIDHNSAHNWLIYDPTMTSESPPVSTAVTAE